MKQCFQTDHHVTLPEPDPCSRDERQHLPALLSDLPPQRWANDFYSWRTSKRLVPFSGFMRTALQPHYIRLIISDLLPLYRLALCAYCPPRCFAVLTPFHTCLPRQGHGAVSQCRPSSTLETSSTSIDAHRCPDLQGSLAWSKAWDHPIYPQEPGWGALAGNMVMELHAQL